MEKESNCKKECINCSSYIQHYVKRNNRYHVIYCGHCINKSNGYYKKTDKVCESYEERDLQKEKDEQLKSATELLSAIAERLHQLTEFLKDDIKPQSET